MNVVTLRNTIASLLSNYLSLEPLDDGSLLNRKSSAIYKSSKDFISALGNTISEINYALDEFLAYQDTHFIQPIVVSAGKGSRAIASGMTVPKPVVEVHGSPVIAKVFDQALSTSATHFTPLVVTSQELLAHVNEALIPRKFISVVQPHPLGTEDAVREALPFLPEECESVLVVWGTQPVIRDQTYRRAIALSLLFPEFKMIVPTGIVKKPYAPVVRNKDGQVARATETRQENAQPPAIGETNLGIFIVKKDALETTLHELWEKYYCKESGKYNRSLGELGFPNEMINALSEKENGVFALPIGDYREAQGIKTLGDVQLCEEYIQWLGKYEKKSCANFRRRSDS